MAEAPRIAQESDSVAAAQAISKRLIANIEQVVLGKHDEIALILSALASGGHVLLEDVPGTAKTILARAIAQTIAGTSFARIHVGSVREGSRKANLWRYTLALSIFCAQSRSVASGTAPRRNPARRIEKAAT